MREVDSLDRAVASAFYGAFLELRPGQVAAVRALAGGGNFVLAAGTGSGKTEAVLVPLVSRYGAQSRLHNSLSILYVTPTRALANDLERRLLLPFEKLGLTVGIRHGDRDDLAAGKRPALLITTPESLDVLLFRDDPNLRSIRAIVVDEVHLLYNTQRGLHLSVLLRRLRQLLQQEFQWAALSATVGSLEDVAKFLFGQTAAVSCYRASVTRRIDAQIRHISHLSDFPKLVERIIADRGGKLLAFVNSRRVCDRLASALATSDKLRGSTFAHYSSLAADLRQETEKQFSTCRTAVCVSTSTLELGIDIGDIDAVVLWGVPPGVESFLQRIGRGNRRSQKSNVICLVPDDSQRPVADALRFAALTDAAEHGAMPMSRPFTLYGAAAQQSLSVIAAGGGGYTRVADICQALAHQSHLDRPTMEVILAELERHGLLRRHGFKNRYGAAEGLHRLVEYRLIHGNFPAGQQTIDIYHGARLLGTVPAANLLKVSPQSVIRFAGRCWRVAKASIDGIQTEPCAPRGGAIDFSYGQWRQDTGPFVADRVWSLLHSHSLKADLFAPRLAEEIERVRTELASTCSRTDLPIRRSPTGIDAFTFAGSKLNRAILLNQNKPGGEVGDLRLSSLTSVNWQGLPSDPGLLAASLDPAPEEQTTFQQLLPAALQKSEALQSWACDQEMERVIQRLRTAKPIVVPNSVVEPFA